MAPLSLKIILADGAVTRTVKFEPTAKVAEAYAIIKEKVVTADDGKEYALFLTSADNDRSGIWLEAHRPLDYYMLRNGDSLLYLLKQRNLRVRMLDGSVKTLQVDESKNIGELMMFICGKIGITNHDEYGLCQEESMEADEVKENRPVTGTLTLKRKAQQRERDAKMDELSKKLKTDDNVDWLDQHKTLRELGVDHNETLLLKRRLFFSDRNVDSRDPVQLNLLYVQTRDAILNGRHPVTEDQAMEFAAIQCQIHFGDFQEDKHKSGLIENLNEYLPEQYSSSWGAEKKILKLYRKHNGLSHLDAKHLYTKTARDLPTYGVTFFVVKEKQKGKKKLVPRLLGINSESILRLDEVTKEILQVWPLTHVKSYYVAKNETFTLNFGDYSEKEYSVKTNDAFRIRDILEGYIDIIRKRLCGPSTAHYADHGALAQDCVESGRGNVMTHIVHTPSKIVQQSFVGPSKIIPFEQGSKVSPGTQVMTVQQVIVTTKGTTTQQVVSGEVPMRSDMSQEFVKKLNRMNSNAVKVVTLLSDPTEANIEQARNIIAAMEEDMPVITAGVKEAAEKQKTEEAKNKLLKELDELNSFVANASQKVKSNNMKPEEVQDQARQIADLTTQMYFSLDPRTQRRSDFVRRSRQSFIEDEKTVATLRRASYIAAAGSASHAVDSTMEMLVEVYQGAPLSDREVDQLKASAVDKLGKLSAAVALFLTAHADSNNINYDAAVNSMNTIKELLPKLATDARSISHTKGGDAGKEIMDEVKALTEAARRVCLLTGCDDHQKIRDATETYGDVSGKLVYILGTRNPRINADKENEIMELARRVGDATTLLLVKANELTACCGDPAGAARLDAAGVVCADAARDLLAAAQLTTPTIREAHCQSALTASTETLSSAAQQLALAWRPLAGAPHAQQLGTDLADATMEVAKALDRLRNAYANLEDMDVDEQHEVVSPEQAQKLRFVVSCNSTRAALQGARDHLNEPITPANLTDSEMNQLQDNISEKLAQTNAAVASLLQAKSDPQNPDYNTAELAINTVSEVMPDVVKDARALLSSCADERARHAMLGDFRAWADALSLVCASAAAEDKKELDDSAQKFAKTSKKLSFAFSPLARKAREQLMMELFSSAHKQALQMVDDTNKMADTLGGANAERLRGLGQDVHSSAQALQSTLMVTSPSLDSGRCRSVLLESSSGLAAAAARLSSEAAALQDGETGCRVLSAQLQQQRAHIAHHAAQLQHALQAIRHTLEDTATLTEHVESPTQKVQRLKFITSASAVQEKAQEVQLLLEQPCETIKLNEQQAKDLEDKRARDLAAVNAAIALLINAKNDRNNPNYSTAEEAIETVSDLMPGIINDTKALSSVCEDEKARAAMLADIRAWSDAIRAVCASAGHGDLTEFVDSAQHFADTSDKLIFVFNPRKVTPKEQQVMQLSQSACSSAQRMVEDSNSTAGALPAARAAEMRVRARALDDAARALKTTSQLTAPSISAPSSRAALRATSERVGASADELVALATAHSEARAKQLGARLEPHKEHLRTVLTAINDACATDGTDAVESPKQKAQRLKFITGVTAVHDKLKSADYLLDQPTLGIKLTEQQAKDVKEKLAQDVARVNAAVASLCQAKSDVQNPDFISAEKAIETISELVPAIAKETQALSTACSDEAARAAVLRDTRAWSDAIRAVCARAERDDPKELEEAVQQLSSASGKMKFIVSVRKNPMKEHEVVQSAQTAVDHALQICEEAERVARSVRGAEPALVLARAEALAHAARALRTAAQLTAPSIHEPASQASLVWNGEAVRAAAAQLAEAARAAGDPALRLLGAELAERQHTLHTALQELSDLCTNKKVSASTLEAQRLKFASSATATEKKAEEVEKLLEQPASGVQLTEQNSKEVQDKLVKAMAQVNAALASLINAKSDSHEPQYDTATQSCATISELLPEIVHGTVELSGGCAEPAARAAQLDETRAWCRAVRALCASAASSDHKVSDECTMKYCNASQKLRFINSARKNPVKEQQVLQLSSSACDKARQMAEETQSVALAVSGADAALLTARAIQLSHAAAHLHTTAQITACTIDSPACQSALLSSVDCLSARASVLVRDTARAEHPAARRLSEEVDRYRAVMDRALASLRAAIRAHDKRGRPPPPPVRNPSTAARGDRRSSGAVGGAAGAGGAGSGVPQSPRVRVVSHSDTRRASQEWLHHMREDASRDLEATLPRGSLTAQDIIMLNKKAEEERLKKEKFENTIHKTEESIQKAELDLNKLSSVKVCADAVEESQCAQAQQQLEQRLARAGTAAARLVAASHPDAIDYTIATQATETLSELMPDIVKDAALLSNTQDETARRALLDHIKALCDATKRLVRTAKNNDLKINEAAVEFGDSSAGLLYAVAAHVDPAQEKEVISLARSAGSAASALAERAAALAGGAGAAQARPLCDAGRACADAAHTLVYTAKLVAPTIHHQQCQNSLISASHELSAQLKNFSNTWKPLSSEPQCANAVLEMTAESNDLEKLLESFRHDLAAGKLVKRREVEKIVVEDTALRQLSSQIMELAQMRAGCGNTPDEKKKLFSEYAGSLRAHIRALDLANTRCKRNPHDLSKHQDLECAVQNLQISLLQGRPTHGDNSQNNVVDLMDFVKSMSKQAENLVSTANKTKVTDEKKEVENIKADCHKINLNAFRLLNPETPQEADESSLDSMLDVDQFGQDCDNRVQNIKKTIDELKEKGAKDPLYTNFVPLMESCHYLRFATKSALATAQSASLDETLDGLNDFEKRLDKMLVPTESEQPVKKGETGAGLLSARCRVVGAATSLPRGAAQLPAALTAYVSELRARTPLHDAHHRNRAKEHVTKVIELLKQLTATAGSRVATWQPVPCAEGAALTHTLIKELENPPTMDTTDGEKSQAILNEDSVNRLLMPADVTIEGEPKKIEEKLQQTASKLVMLSDTLTQSAVRPESLARTAPAAVDAALQLAAAARSLPAQSAAQRVRRSEAAQELCWATYSLLRAAELVARAPAQGPARARLASAARTLTDAINKLARTSSSGDKLGAACGELTRALQARLGRAAAAQPAPHAAPPYALCLQALDSQRDVLVKLNSDEPMSREEFSKSLNYVTSAVCNTTDYAAQCAYLISLSENNLELAKEGLVDVPRLQKLTSSMQESCYLIMRTNQVELAKEEESKVCRVNVELQQAVKEAAGRTRDAGFKRELTERAFKLDHAAKALHTVVHDTHASVDKITAQTLTLVDMAGALGAALERPGLLPAAGPLAPRTRALTDDVIAHSKTLISKTQALIKEVKGSDEDADPMTWVTYNTQRKSVVDAFDALLASLKRNGEQSGLVEVVKEEEEPEVRQWSFVRIQEETARKWLQRRPSRAEVQRSGEDAARAVLDVAVQMSEDMKGHEKDEMQTLISESRALVVECSNKYDNDKASALMEQLREVRRAVERGAVTCVVEDLLSAAEPLQDLELFLDAETDEAKRKFLLEQKIAELMSQLGRVTRTARLVARAGAAPAPQLDHCRQQTELLAPALVAAAQARVATPHDEGAVQHYRALLAQYAESLTRVRELCDHAVDPLDFVQTAGETMSRMREESSQHNDPRQCAYTSNAITRLASRVIVVSMSSPVARADPELRAALAEAQGKLQAAAPAPGTRASRLPDWKDTTAEILRTTGEVESALGGENIFKKLPEPDQPIYNAALSLHSAVRGWSARDNEIVAVAKRMAVLMARLSEQMSTERKRELIATSKSIVTESREVAALAKKLAQECTDVRIKTNLLQVCERIPTISGQLKMLTTVKGSTLGNQGGEEDREAMNMLVTNAQNLMSSVQEVIKAAASASVKIASQRGLKWVRKNY